MLPDWQHSRRKSDWSMETSAAFSSERKHLADGLARQVALTRITLTPLSFNHHSQHLNATSAQCFHIGLSHLGRLSTRKSRSKGLTCLAKESKSVFGPISDSKHDKRAFLSHGMPMSNKSFSYVHRCISCRYSPWSANSEGLICSYGQSNKNGCRISFTISKRELNGNMTFKSAAKRFFHLMK